MGTPRSVVDPYPVPPGRVMTSTSSMRQTSDCQGYRVIRFSKRVETFGDPDTHWVRITVDPSKPELFTIGPEIVPDNKAN